ncbi:MULTISPECIES: DUF806 family protein [Lactiplantibacillus]|uniref:DUF806 family protein n=1 Tax=Lactiplantibacillus TaxID=2767842 RepID=UPI000D01DA0E|nr:MULTISPECIES: DUF806 family protein [Lactiplantibacillus]MCA1344034.1 DUF806 family protein [Lactiplantibacillus pentosus]MCJ8183919.1 DUF806 family protein [Lactiplantibacillus pentosus]MCT3310964.1 DUF806 family protein [Lactiplantibacillus pentosus]PRO92650.1 phage tail protein [Lactiplantibacillus pentosus]WKF80428.1 DUF806 family protein [Lactiplantibacillus plantarum]
MQLPVIQAENLLKTVNYDWIDNIYRGSIPKSANNAGTTTDVVITESENTPSNYANSQFKHWALGVEIQIFYKKANQTDILPAEIELAKMFIANGWRVEQSKNHTKDPDTGQVTKVFYFTKIEII